MASLEILELLGPVTIQDKGRIGYQRYGVPRGGAMDHYALAEGQALLGDDPETAALEFQFGGGTFVSHGTMTLATSGGQMEILLDQKPLPWRSTFTIYPNQVLQIRKTRSGIYSYLHLPGGIDSSKILGSRSTHIASGLGDVPKVGYHLSPLSENLFRKEGLTLPAPEYFNVEALRIVYGPHSELFSDSDRKNLTLKRFRMSSSRNRMGARINPIDWKISALAGKTLVSDPIVAGDIQVAADGTTAILLAESQPTGGYPRIASVITSDLPKVAQMQPGTEFKFQLVSNREAQIEFKKSSSRISDLSHSLKPLVRDPFQMQDLLHYNFISGVTKGEGNDSY